LDNYFHGVSSKHRTGGHEVKLPPRANGTSHAEIAVGPPQAKSTIENLTIGDCSPGKKSPIPHAVVSGSYLNDSERKESTKQ